MPREQTTSGVTPIAATLTATLIVYSLQAFFFPFSQQMVATAEGDSLTKAVSTGAADYRGKLAGSDGADRPTDPDEDDGGWHGACLIDFWIRGKSNPSGGSKRIVRALRAASWSITFRRPLRCVRTSIVDEWFRPPGTQCCDPNHPCHAPPYFLSIKTNA